VALGVQWYFCLAAWIRPSFLRTFPPKDLSAMRSASITASDIAWN
jgi:hypothetical protein